MTLAEEIDTEGMAYPVGSATLGFTRVGDVRLAVCAGEALCANTFPVRHTTVE